MPWPGMEQQCWRTLEEAVGGRRAGWPCRGRTRTLYVREIERGQAKGWRAVGTVCLRCHHVELDEGLLPQQPRRTH